MPKLILTFDETQSAHTVQGHPENHRRLEAVYNHLANAGILARTEVHRPEAVDWNLVERVHGKAYLASIRSLNPDRTIWIDPDTYFTPDSLDIALRAAGGSVYCVDKVASGEVLRALVLPRPPGHHATRSTAMGFCLLNHTAIAARHLLDVHRAERLAIVDFDVHHGNGTQDIFYNDPNVLFLSVHESPLFPGTGAASERGGPNAPNKTLNVPLPAGCGDDVYEIVFRQIFEPAINAFEPDFLLVSAGFDVHWRDPLANMHLTISGFSVLLKIIFEWADRWTDGKLVAYLEGGYDLEVLPLSVAAMVQLLIQPDSQIIDPIGSGRRPNRVPEDVLQPYLG